MSASSSIATFNGNLTRAKLAALQILQDLMSSLADPDPPIPARYRELRLLACAILRTAPMKPAPTDQDHSSPPRPTGADQPAPASPSHPASPELPATSPTPRPFNPHQEWARAAIRSLVADGRLPPSLLSMLAAPSLPHRMYKTRLPRPPP